ncbi:unnamed protein product, partial [Rotaria sp. Silwood2]
MDESVSQTIHRLTTNIERAMIKENKLNKRRQKKPAKVTSDIEKQIIVVELFDDNNNQPIDENEINKNAWFNCRRLSINGQSYSVEYNAPGFSFYNH